MITPKTATEARKMFSAHCAQATTAHLRLLIKKITAHPKSKNGSFLFGLKIAQDELNRRRTF